MHKNFFVSVRLEKSLSCTRCSRQAIKSLERFSWPWEISNAKLWKKTSLKFSGQNAPTFFLFFFFLFQKRILNHSQKKRFPSSSFKMQKNFFVYVRFEQSLSTAWCCWHRGKSEEWTSRGGEILLGKILGEKNLLNFLGKMKTQQNRKIPNVLKG